MTHCDCCYRKGQDLTECCGKRRCPACHRIGGQGSPAPGFDLTHIGSMLHITLMDSRIGFLYTINQQLYQRIITKRLIT